MGRCKEWLAERIENDLPQVINERYPHFEGLSANEQQNIEEAVIGELWEKAMNGYYDGE